MVEVAQLYDQEAMTQPHPLDGPVYTDLKLPDTCPKCKRTGRNLQAVALGRWECSTERCPIRPKEIGMPVNLHGRLSDEWTTENGRAGGA